ncbi:hypothetical protein ACJ6WD_35325 [Streptomyces sp. VTCC 41912]|uniref:hypothetical protein n=1 Tax=Streptomyces sp. VTCC 41912 TaxID=3383243 RepID=UPI003896A04D
MTSIPERHLPIRTQAVTEGLWDATSEAWSAWEQLKTLDGLGIRTQLLLDPAGISVNITLDRSSASLLPVLAGELEQVTITHVSLPDRPAAAEIVGTMCEHRIPVCITVPRAYLDDNVMARVLAASDLHPSLSYSSADDAWMEQAA